MNENLGIGPTSIGLEASSRGLGCDLDGRLRALLMTDGTVTVLLEALRGEPIAVVRDAMGLGKAPELRKWLELEAEATVLRTTARLVGVDTDEVYAATTTTVAGRFPNGSSCLIDFNGCVVDWENCYARIEWRLSANY